jgi:serine/threonine protein kinase
MSVVVGSRLGHYEILSTLGAGGMGEVYLAQDSKLGRRVALKLLPSEFTKDESRVRRFQQEARAASALNHPNILTIHEIGSENNTYFIATEFIEGRTLRDYMSAAQMKTSEVLDVATQVASALAAAHAAGVVHRDIKPENIMLRHDRIVKVLDFGLAKLTERETTDTEAPTLVNTDAGVVMGTARYMSPEQVRGLAVDARTDVWSLGVVTHEMLTGRVPFAGETASDVIAAVLEREPQPLVSSGEEIPLELKRIVSKALRKDCEERYQTIKDMLVDLKSLKQELEFDAKMKRSTQSQSQGVEGTPTSIEQTTTVKQTAAPTPSAEYVVSGIKRHKFKVGVLLVALLLAGTAIAYFGYFGRADKDAITSIAVLPFVNASADPNMEYLSDGLAESLINSLSQLPKLRVVPRSTVFRYKGREVDPQTVGRELGVRAVLTGKLVQRGDTLSIQTELVDVAEESQLWGEQYNRKLADLLAVQEEISREISEKLRIRLSGEERKQLAKRYTENTEAYQLYLKGRYYWNKRTPEDLKKGIGYFQQAIDIDPNYALAFAGLADSYIIFGNFGLLPPKEVYPKARGAAQKALEIDGNLAEAQVSMAFVKALFEWDWQGADAGFKRAIELNPNYGPAHQWYGVYLAGAGRLTEAVAQAQRAQEVDPLSLTINSVVGWMLYFDRQYDRAIEQEKKTLEMDPNFVLSYRYRGMAYEQKGMYPEAIADLQNAVTLSGSRTTVLGPLGHAYAIAGRRSEARKVLDEVMQLRARAYFPSYEIALIYTGMGEKDQAFEWLDKAYEERSPWLIHLRVDPRFETLYSDPRYADMLRRIGLPQ